MKFCSHLNQLSKFALFNKSIFTFLQKEVKFTFSPFISWGFLFFALAYSNVTIAQVFDPRVNCINGCNAKDIKAITAALVYPNAPYNQLPTSFSCNNGEPVEVKLAIFLTTSTQKAGLYAYANVRNATTNALITTVSECVSSGALTSVSGVTKVVFTPLITWSCGTAIKLTDVYVGWGTGTDDFCQGSTLPRCPTTTAKCFSIAPGSYVPVVIPVGTPADATKCSDVALGTTATFNLHSMDATILGLQTGTVSYYSNEALTTAIGTVAQENAYQSVSKTIYAKIVSNGVSSAAIPIMLTVKTTPGAPTVGVVNNCNGSSDLTASDYTGSLLWSNNTATASIHVTDAATYTVTQTVNGCTSPTGSGTSAPKTTPGAPKVDVVNNCDGSSDLTASDYTGTLLWSNNATTESIHVTNAATYTVTQTVNGCTSSTGSGTSAPRTTPGAPKVDVVNNCDGSSDLTASDYTGSLLWSNNATTASIQVTDAATYTVTQTVNGCTSSTGSGTSAPKTTPGAPKVDVVNNCDGSSDLTASDYTGSLLWSNNATTASIHVTDAATYTVTQTVNGCTSSTGSGVSAPRTTPGAPTVDVVNNCDGSSDLTASDYTGTLLWSNNATTASIHVTNAATYTVTQTVNGCVSLAGSGDATPKTTADAPTVCLVQPSLCGPVTGSVTILSPLGDGYAYSINNGTSYQSGNAFPGLAPGAVTGILVKKDGCVSDPADCNVSNCEEPTVQSKAKSSVTTLGKTKSIQPDRKKIIDQATVRAYPNPFSQKVKFVVTSSVAGKGSLDVYNALGQKVKTVFSGLIYAGSQTFELNMPVNKQSNLSYILRMGDKNISGKLIQLNE